MAQLSSASEAEHIKVWCRLRGSAPEDDSPEDEHGSSSAFLTPQGDDNESSAFEMFNEATAECEYRRPSDNEGKRFRFDGLLGPGSSQGQVFESVAAKIVDGCLEGFNGAATSLRAFLVSGRVEVIYDTHHCDLFVRPTWSVVRAPRWVDSLSHLSSSRHLPPLRPRSRPPPPLPLGPLRPGAILAYGQTSSGKTFSMRGADGGFEGPGAGVVPRALARLLEARDRAEPGALALSISCVEIYCEMLQDLLAPGTAGPGGLSIREAPGGASQPPSKKKLCTSSPPPHVPPTGWQIHGATPGALLGSQHAPGDLLSSLHPLF